MIDTNNILTNPEKVEDVRKSAEEMDEQRQKTLAYEYLCHLEEAKKWMEACLKVLLPPTTELEENLRNGVYLAKIGHFMAPDILPLNKIYDSEQRRYKIAGLQFRHTDNINHFLRCLTYMQLPLTFQPETTDIYDKKNMPRVIYCIHALSTHLFKLGKAPQIQDLYGKISFTDEEINTVSKELQEYGIQMPSFQKIGGLLTNGTDADVLYAAVIVINEAVAENDNVKVLNALNIKTAQLNNIIPIYINEYTKTLLRAKNEKVEVALNKSLNESYVSDVYDEILTQAEIQGHINYVNAQRSLEAIISSINCNNIQLIQTLRMSTLPFKNILLENAETYKTELRLLFKNAEWNNIQSESIHCRQELLQNTIDQANKIAQQSRKREEIIKRLNMALRLNDKKEFYNALQSPYLGLSDYVDEFAFPLYYEEMKEDRAISQMDITYDDILVSIRVLSLIATIGKAIDTRNPDFIYQKLSNPDARISELDEENKVRYADALIIARHEKRFKECPLLTYADIQECIDLVNMQCNEDSEVIRILRQLSINVMKNDEKSMIKALESITKIEISLNNGPLYSKLLKKCLIEKRPDGSELWLDDVKTTIEKVASEFKKVSDVCTLLQQINKAIERNNISNAINCLEILGIILPKTYKAECFRSLQQLKKRKRELYKCPYISYITDEGNEAYIDLRTHTILWNCPKNIEESYHITIEDIKEITNSIMPEECQINNNIIYEKIITRFQARIRGYLLRKKIKNRYFHNNLKKIIRIQALWRGIIQRKQYRTLLEERRKQNKLLNTNKNRNYRDDILNRYNDKENKIIKIQAMWRGRASRKAFHSLLHSEKPSFPIVRHFSAILGFNAEDYDKDLELQKLKHEVVQSIKHNQKLSQQLESMYIKIGLLIQNRIALQDVVAYSKNLDTVAKEKDINSLSDGIVPMSKGLKSLTKEGRKMLEGYQHLFYALQTNPQYLAKLLHLPPHGKASQLFLKNIILTLFNFGSNTREDYLLLKLFDFALREEIKYNCQKPSDVLTGKSLVREMVVNYAKQANGQRSLKQLLEPLIQKILLDRSLNIETNPVDIYKFWRIQLEMESGKSQDLPFAVTQQQALSYNEVRNRLNKGIYLLKKTVLAFLDRITASRDLIPYGMLYTAKVLYNSLLEKFPEVLEKDVLKAVGNLIYYHFINAAIVAPDSFDIVKLPVDISLSTRQRKNLASVAKILHFAASKKGFGEEAPHLECLNQFIIDCHEKLKTFFRYCCQVEDLGEHFNIHEYTEATLIENPEICISLQEICDMHSLMLNYQEQIAPDQFDPLHDLLDDLGPNPTVASLLGIPDSTYEANFARYSKTEVCLVLTNKFLVLENENKNLGNLFIKAKELLVSVIPFLKQQTLVESLETTSSPMHVKLFDYQYSTVSPALNIVRESSSINDCKLQLHAYLHKLELEGWVSRTDDYQTIITAIAKDISNKKKYRIIRNNELQTLRITKKQLDEKTKYYQEQVEFYNEYIQRCLQNLHTGKGSLHAFKIIQKTTHHKLRSKMTLKYSASKLQEKGILLEIDGLSQIEFKNVIFEISPTEYSGLFIVRCKFMGVEMEKLNVNIQKLLELQYEGVSVINMFEKAKINVNLLLYLLNRKFYGKT